MWFGSKKDAPAVEVEGGRNMYYYRGENYFKLEPRVDAAIFIVCFIATIIALTTFLIMNEGEDYPDMDDFIKEDASKDDKIAAKKVQKFKSRQSLSPKDQVVLDMLDPIKHSFVITDPHQNDNPIIYASDGFCRFTHYDRDEIIGRNCRFLQGPKTNALDVAKIRNAVSSNQDTNVSVLNYKKTGESFVNQFFVCPLRAANKSKPIYYLGVQHEVLEVSKGQYTENPGWLYTVGSHR